MMSTPLAAHRNNIYAEINIFVSWCEVAEDSVTCGCDMDGQRLSYSDKQETPSLRGRGAWSIIISLGERLDLDLLIRKLVRVRMRFPEIEEIRGTGLDLEKGARYLLIIRRD
jgi:hypothetical protein